MAPPSEASKSLTMEDIVVLVVREQEPKLRMELVIPLNVESGKLVIDEDAECRSTDLVVMERKKEETSERENNHLELLKSGKRRKMGTE